MRSLADLPFWSAYSLFVLFLGHLHQTASLGTSSRLFPLWAFLNVFMYALILLLSITLLISYTQSDTRNFAGELVQYIMGAGYIGLLGLLIQHSWLLHRTIRPFLTLLPSGLFQGLVRLTVLIALLLIVQAASFILVATKLSYGLHHAPCACGSMCLADFVSSAGLELIPSYLAMYHLHAFKYELFRFPSFSHSEGSMVRYPSFASYHSIGSHIHDATSHSCLLSFAAPEHSAEPKIPL